MYSTWPAMSDSSVLNVPVPDPGGESRTRIRNPSALSSMYLSSPPPAPPNLGMVWSPPSSPVAMLSSRSTSRSTTTAYRPSLPPKCSYTTGLDTPACAAISSIEVPSNPRSANRRRPMLSSCSRRSFPVIRLRPEGCGCALTCASSRLRGHHATYPAGAPRHRAEFLLRRGGPLGGRPVLVRPAHVVGPAQLLQRPDDARTGVELALQRAVPRAGRVGVVQVVPGLTERRDRHPGHVLRLVACLEFRRAERVADRVDRPGDVVQQRDPDQAGPEEGGQRALPGHPPQAADKRREQQRDRDEPREPGIYRLDPPVGEQVGGELLLRGLVRVEEPADMRVEQALGQRLRVIAVPPRGVRVALLVAVLVVPAVVRHPGDDGPLDAQAARDRQSDPRAGFGLERAVGEIPVVADGHAESG